MAAPPGLTIEQKVIRVADNDTAINAEITTQSADDWILQEIVISGANMVLLFNRTTVTPVPV
jgi:hypothetical protein